MKNRNIGLTPPDSIPLSRDRSQTSFQNSCKFMIRLVPSSGGLCGNSTPPRQTETVPSLHIHFMAPGCFDISQVSAVCTSLVSGSSHQMSPNVSLNPLQLITVYYLMMINISIAVFTDALDCYPWMVAGVTVSLKPITSLSPIDLHSMPQ